MIKQAWVYFICHIVRFSGLLWFLSMLMTGLATGQAEVSYHYWFYGNVVSLAILISARIEGKYFMHHYNRITKEI